MTTVCAGCQSTSLDVNGQRCVVSEGTAAPAGAPAPAEASATSPRRGRAAMAHHDPTTAPGPGAITGRELWQRYGDRWDIPFQPDLRGLSPERRSADRRG